MRSLLIIIMGFVLTACAVATTKKYDMLLNQWINKSETALVTSWGAPNSVYTVGDKKFLSYYSHYKRYVPDTNYNYEPVFTPRRVYYQPVMDTHYQIIAETCKTTFIIESEKVVSWSHRGDGCLAN